MKIWSPHVLLICFFFLLFFTACQKESADQFTHSWEVTAEARYEENGLPLFDTTQQWNLNLLENGTGSLNRTDAAIPVFWDYREADEAIELRLEEPTSPQISTTRYVFSITSNQWRTMVWEEKRDLSIQNDQGTLDQQCWYFRWDLRR